MQTIGQSKLWTFTADELKATVASCSDIRRKDAFIVQDYMDLARRIAELQFRNREHVLMFRGQNGDFKNQNDLTTLKPCLFRQINGRNPDGALLAHRFEKLAQAESALVEAFSENSQLGIGRLKRQRLLRWSILQHYEVCPTPLLDVTHSLRIAASFASLDSEDMGYVFVIGVPNVSGAITASAESGLQVVKLASVCPPSAIRPHIQEGYLIGEYPEMTGYEQKQHYKHYEIDFGRRLVAKFAFYPARFWRANKDFPKVERSALYPNRADPLYRLARDIKRNLD
jgi:hypothetical protein